MKAIRTPVMYITNPRAYATRILTRGVGELDVLLRRGWPDPVYDSLTRQRNLLRAEVARRGAGS